MSGWEVIYGVHPVVELLRAQPGDIKEILIARGRRAPAIAEVEALAQAAGVKVHLRPPEALTQLCRSEHHQGLAAFVKGFDYLDEEDLAARCEASPTPPLVVMLDEIQDPQNLGAILRSAYALGATAAVIPRNRAASVTPAVARAAAGATSHLALAQVTNLARTMERLHTESGLWMVGLTQNAPAPLQSLDLTVPVGLVIGSEGKGLRPIVQAGCHLTGRIPMVGEISSLNASAAAAIALYEIGRQRTLKG